MQKDIQEALYPLIGLHLWGSTRACDMASFQFGGPHIIITEYDQIRTVPTWTLDIQCAWRIRDPNKIIAASADCYIRADHVSESDENFHWDVKGENQRDQRIKEFMESNKNSLKVKNMVANNMRYICLKLISGYYLEVFADVSAEDREYWRLFQPGMDGLHFVVTTQGIENDI